MRILIYIFLMFFFFVGYAKAECNGSWGINSQRVLSNDLSNAPKILVEIEVSNSLMSCDIKGVFIKTNTEGRIKFSSHGGSLVADVTDTSGNSYQSNSIQRVFVPFGRLATTQRFELRFPTIDRAKPGDYTGTIIAQLEGVRGAPRRTQASLKVYPYIAMYFQGSGLSNNRLNLGVLKTGMIKSFELGVESNAAYSILIESKFEGLQHETSGSSKLLEYKLSIDGRIVSFGEPLNFSIPPSSGYKKAFLFELGSTEGAISGRYRDYVTVTAIANP
ncbi:hypothetical protein [Vibrio breoganii]|uniref:hypothetical protein n=1 Tax=Vibrio breoganii TaxID=553239 RepID=UPI00031635D4|nr:hypothetical protein [Vibrio breoganii]OEF83347.1 hypothetical protein B003_01455 [Vibrio breoganii 1C10]PMG92703.1 hypothetical protein BCU79_15540 [Vibrio breoganii]PMH15304.1 hypothetical protein BCU74_02520 [Vibrio breoganii]PMJ50050.1 hypothetical protein BCU21_00090 [Vibrio breoganii]PMK63280.1 hypothetical protein BCT97_01895 [Vibrio breoganii]